MGNQAKKKRPPKRALEVEEADFAQSLRLSETYQNWPSEL